MAQLTGTPLGPDRQKRQAERLLLRRDPPGSDPAAAAFSPLITPVRRGLELPVPTDQGFDDRLLARIEKGRSHWPSAIRCPIDPIQDALHKGVLLRMKMLPDR